MKDTRSIVAVVAWLVVSGLSVSFQPAYSSLQKCSTLYLLNVQPFPDNSGSLDAGFDGGLSLIPAAHLAAEEINNRSDILTGLELRVIDIDAEACGRATITKGLINLYKELINRDCVVGIIGYPCSSSTNVLAPVTGHPGLGYITLANSVSSEHRNRTNFPNLFHTISSSSVHNKALVSLMQMFNWKRIGLVYESLAFFFTSTAKDFAQRVNDLPETELITDVPIISTLQSIRSAFDIISSEEARISYWLGTDGQNALCVCEAYKRRFLWPGYAYILRSNPSIINNLLKANTSCSKDEMLAAMEGIFMLDYRPYVDDNTCLFSGWTYSEFRQRYADKLNAFANQLDMNLTESIYANYFYDQVWTYALAINNSLPFIYSQNLSFSDRNSVNTVTISHVLQHQLLNLSFQGASGWIQFDENYEIPSFVDVFQIQNATLKRIAIYDPFTMNFSLKENFPQEIPGDTFDTFYSFLPLWLGVCIFIIQGALFFLITTNMVLLFCWRKEREVKATSFILSMLLTVGCYLLTVAPVIRTAYRVTVIQNTTIHTVMCSMSLWSSSLGLDLILTTLLFRLFRVVYVFRSFQKTSKYFSDEYLLLYTLMTCSVKVLILVIWSARDLYRSVTIREYVPTVIPAKYSVIVFCSCNELGLWLSISFMYSVLLLSLVLFFAIQTRRIKKNFYKDTKKVNTFVFLVIITLTTTIPLRVIFSEIGIQTGADIAEWIGVCFVATACQFCVIVPKLLPLAVKKYKMKKGVTLSREYTLASEFEWVKRKSRTSISKLIT